VQTANLLRDKTSQILKRNFVQITIVKPNKFQISNQKIRTGFKKAYRRYFK